ncbi:class I adenylate-forming enzyme family protein [uncultured Sphingomonas sp.]|uniref:class I adenylate-forming enzyme family protein n=1 Tax=uncultured Sphingomonas sp. TaxID=158754 RepID=UPI0035CC8FCB
MTLEEQCRAALTRDPDLPALEYRGEWVRWGWMRGVADRINALLDDAGLDPRAPIGFVPRNRPSAAAAMLGMIARGRTIRMIYAFQSPTGIARDVGRLKLAAVIAGAEELADEVLAVAAEQGIAAIALGEVDGAAAITGFERSTATPDPDAPADPQIQILTSGTTGPPKHFAVGYEMIAKHIVGFNVTYQENEDVSALPPAMLYFPFGNISGVYGLLPPTLKGHPAVLLDRFRIEDWLDYVRRYRPNRCSLPPAGIRMVLDADVPKEDLASVTTIGTGAAPLDPTVQRAFEERYGIPILLSYGATEFGGPVTAMTAEMIPEWGAKKFGSVGRPFAGAKLRVLDVETGEELPPGKEGLLEVISPRIGPDWITTTDIGMIDEDGFIFHRGRSDGAIMRGGFKLLPETIGRALMLHPAIAATAVVGIRDERLGQVPVAAIQLKPDAAQPTTEELDTHLRAHVYATHIPVAYRFVAALPRTPSMKVDLPAVAALFEQTVVATSG